MNSTHITLSVSDGVWLAFAEINDEPRFDGSGDTVELALHDMCEQMLAVLAGQGQAKPAQTEGLVEGSMGTKSVLAAIIGQQGGEVLLGDTDFEGVSQNPTIEVRQHRGKQRYTVAKGT